VTKKIRIRKADVIAPIDRESARMLRLAEELENKAATAVGEWSPRDVIAHCIYWQGMLARMMGAPLPPPSWIPRWQSEDQIGTDELNRLTVEHYRGMAFETVLADFRFTADLVKKIVTEMKEENLTLPAGEPWEKGMTVHEAIAGETHAHWKDHADQLEAALEGSTA
jgi:hypothetical protein